MGRFPQSSIDAFGRWGSTRKWFEEAAPNATVDDLASSFTSQLAQAINLIFPPRSVKPTYYRQTLDNTRNQEPYKRPPESLPQ